MTPENIKIVVSLDYLRDAIICSQLSELLDVEPWAREYAKTQHEVCNALYQHILPMCPDDAFRDLIQIRRWRDLRKLEQASKKRGFK